MAKFNTTKSVETTKTTNFAGGDAYQLSEKQNLISIFWNSFLESSYYEDKLSAKDRFTTIFSETKDKKFLAKLAVYSRNVLGIRSITHLAASEIALSVKNETWTKAFFNAIVSRVDDMSEIVSAYKDRGGKMLPHSLQKGFKVAFNRFDEYQLAKYQAKDKTWKLLDLVNLIKPKPNEKNKDALKKLILNGSLVNTETWEAKLSKAGQQETEEDKAEAKKEAWEDLIKSKKLGYFALLRNLRNIIQQAPHLIDEVVELLTNEDSIKKSKVLPFRFLSAYKEIVKLSGTEGLQKLIVGLSWAIDIAMNNVPKFDGKNLVVLDISGSMTDHISDKSTATRIEIASLFAAAIIKNNHSSDLVVFNGSSKYVTINPLDSSLTITNKLADLVGGGTNVARVFPILNKAYDRIIILSDEQSWGSYNSPVDEFKKYKNKFSANPKLYCFNLASYGSIQFPEKDVYCISGFSEKIFDLITKLEEDKSALIEEIEAVTF